MDGSECACRQPNGQLAPDRTERFSCERQLRTGGSVCGGLKSTARSACVCRQTSGQAVPNQAECFSCKQQTESGRKCTRSADRFGRVCRQPRGQVAPNRAEPFSREWKGQTGESGCDGVRLVDRPLQVHLSATVRAGCAESGGTVFMRAATTDGSNRMRRSDSVDGWLRVHLSATARAGCTESSGMFFMRAETANRRNRMRRTERGWSATPSAPVTNRASRLVRIEQHAFHTSGNGGRKEVYVAAWTWATAPSVSVDNRAGSLYKIERNSFHTSGNYGREQSDAAD